MKRELVFAYGTLTSSGRNPMSSMAGGELVGTGRILGQLFDLGWYPGYKPFARIDDGASAYVEGELWAIPHGELSTLDSYEGYPFLYDRQRVWVECNGDMQEAWVYIYNEDVDESRRIKSGSWIQHLKERATV